MAGQGAAATASCAAAPQTLPQLSLQTARNGRLAAGESTCLTMTLRRGEFVRVVIAADSGALRARLLGPHGKQPLVSGNSAVFIPPCRVR